MPSQKVMEAEARSKEKEKAEQEQLAKNLEEEKVKKKEEEARRCAAKAEEAERDKKRAGKEEEARRCAVITEEADRDKKRAAKVLERKEEEALNKAKKIEAKKKMSDINKAAVEEGGDVEMEHINVDNKGPTSGAGGVNMTTTSPNKGGEEDTEETRAVKKARKEKKKARKEKRAREVAEATKGSPAASDPSVTSRPAGLRRATFKFSSPLKSLKFDKYSHTFKREHTTASVILSADEKIQQIENEDSNVGKSGTES